MENGIPLKVEDYICEDNQIYFIASYPYIIGQYDCQLDMMNILFDYSQTIGAFSAFTRIIKYKHKIYCIPCQADNIYCYNLDSRKFYSLNIPDVVFEKMPSRKIIEAIEVRGTIYCVCRSPHFVLTIDTETDGYQIHYCNENMEEHELFSLKVKDNCIIYPFFHNLIVSFDIGEKKFQIKKLYDTKIQNNWDYIFHFLYDETGCIWVCNYRGEVYSVKDNKIESIKLHQEYIDGHSNIKRDYRYMISEMLYKKGKIYFIIADLEGFRILQYEISDKRFKWIETKQCRQPERKVIRCDNCKISNNRIYIYRFDDNKFYRWDFQGKSIDEFNIVISGHLAADLQLDFSQNESVCTNLEFYLSYLQNLCNGSVRKDNSVKEEIGKMIYLSS